MMAQKALLFGDKETFDKIMVCDSPRECKKLGREISNFDDSTWNHYKEDIVYSGNFLKFTQNPQLAKQLIEDAYGDLQPYASPRRFVECNARDKIWGIGLGINDESIHDESKWVGHNLLGEILSELSCFLHDFIFEVK
jgi:ribA/ribD-fused uncharacterized protein